MTETNTKILKIDKFEHKIGKSSGKPYLKVECDSIWYSAFDAEIISRLALSVGQKLVVEVQEKDNYKNIVKITGEAELEGNEIPNAQDMNVKAHTSSSSQGKGTSYYTAYAKDIFISMEDLDSISQEVKMEMAIKLVKQAQEAFS